ncbi:MAG TPA: glycosyltransferase [Gemmatimonadales bacterium]|nr:glycosyltransferase [Gemmatimonadales bacterium]
MSTTPAVTVLMAVHNGARDLRAAIESILAQTFADFEFLIVDDGSDDGSREIVASYPDPRIRRIDNERNLGLSASLNRGLAAAAGELVARQDADDISEPSRLATQVRFLMQHPDTAVVGSWYTKIDADGVELGRRELPADPVAIRWAMLFHCPLVHSAVTFRRGLLARTTGFYDESFAYAQDYELWSRVARRLPMANVPAYLLRLRVSPWSMTATYGERTLEGPRVSLANIGALRGSGQGPSAGYAGRLAVMQALLLGGALPDDASEGGGAGLADAIREILTLHDDFRRAEGLERGAGDALRRDVEARVAGRLLALAAEPASARSGRAGALLGAAWRVRPSALASTAGVRAAVRAGVGALAGRGA